MDEFELPDGLRDEMRGAWHRYLDLLNPFRPALHAYCRRLTSNLWDAEDLAQDTLLRAFGSLGRHHDRIRNPRAYLLRTATNAWIDQLRRRETESKALAYSEPPASPPLPSGGAVHDAGRALLERLAPQERAAVILKDVFDMSLDESAEVLATTTGAVKAALHRGRTRLRAPEEQAVRNHPSPALVDRFVELFNAADRPGLLELVLDNATVENVGVGAQYGREQHRGKHSWFDGALGGHPEWPEQWHYEARRAERALLDGEPIVLFRVTRRGNEAVEMLVRLEEQEGRVSKLRSYAFCPETMRAVGEELGERVRTGIYRYPTPEPGRTYGDPRPADGETT
jgi:RNA polymerase sigma-70 factor (ECF subfamily)